MNRGARELLGCDCNTVAAHGRCARRSSDGTLWAVYASDDALICELTRCSLEDSGRVSHACEFASCELPPLSTCTLAATCADRGCDNTSYDLIETRGVLPFARSAPRVCASAKPRAAACAGPCFSMRRAWHPQRPCIRNDT